MRGGATAAEKRGANDAARANAFRELFVGGEEAEDVSGHQDSSAGFGFANERFGRGHVQRDGLFREYVFTRAKGGYCGGRVLIGRKADIDGVNCGIRQRASASDW